ncbi:aldehyde dehydrogenase (NADP(+)) [Marivita sp. XM-24bin2]|jgi:NADP-dependent aldehyde dehydrogenase|uniref:aldehyde dehydrogenase (NADP(+)) n=1 Tax=unclassified Marivita TaxID=2632480 RepID=UPI000D7B6C9B|nr:aldehyde dehydrogenase (NADP(+)) [Marivita sp. XM-24bin2]MCR9110981.1 aldehyde dehydrogenase (NADP(+)) [Paracoccaceae bacterium]PWL33353.1 MAG: aldehyde dehydrogenase (NADP(+)) [Marivita sp. XM-24bin2]
MTYQPHGKHLIAGEWVASDTTFSSQPVSGEAMNVSAGGSAEVDRAVQAAEEAFLTYGWTSRDERAAFLEAIADEIEARGADITRLGCAETGLPEARLQGERGRTTGQIRLFADHIRKGEYLDRRHDEALPDRQPLPRPDLKMMQRPIGPVAVFGASNFPLAFSTAGGDTASALAAGCPVVVKGHPAHPATGEIVADAIAAAAARTGMPAGVFSLIQGTSHELGRALVQHPLIRAVGFTGSLGAGRALFDLCAARPEPIPFFGELGSINPVFVLPEALSSRGAELGGEWAASLTMGVGQFCTNPGIVVAAEGPGLAAFVDAATDALKAAGEAVMLTEGIADAYRRGVAEVGSANGVQELLKSTCDRRNAAPAVYKVDAETWLANEALGEEVFGPLGILVTANAPSQMLDLAKSLKGQLTATLQMDEADTDTAQALVPVLERKAGRLLVNGFPTGVEVADAMVHGGPYPASTNFGATSVGTLAIRRFLRPVCYQNMPEELLPDA